MLDIHSLDMRTNIQQIITVNHTYVGITYKLVHARIFDRWYPTYVKFIFKNVRRIINLVLES